MASKVGQFVKERSEELQYDPEDHQEEEKKVTVRLRASTVEALDRIAGKLVMTRTACAERLLIVAIDEADVHIMEDPYLSLRNGIPADKIAAIEEDEEVRAAIADMVEEAGSSLAQERNELTKQAHRLGAF